MLLCFRASHAPWIYEDGDGIKKTWPVGLFREYSISHFQNFLIILAHVVEV